MTLPADFRVAEGYARYSPQANVTWLELCDLVCGSITYAGTHGITRLLIDTRGLSGFDPPTTFQRFFLGERVAREAAGVVRIACVAPPEMFDPDNLLTVVAQNRGVVGEMFTDATEALAWLLAR
jgi:hypothetical protein